MDGCWIGFRQQTGDRTDRGDPGSTPSRLACQAELSLNTVKRYVRAVEPGRMIRAPKYRATLVDPHHDHLRAGRTEDPAVQVQRLLAEIRYRWATPRA
jgi:hypothetical protein